jgi:hypothetical protein
VEVGSAPAALANEVGLLVVGGPTHVLGMSRPSTREDAARQLAVSAGPGTAEKNVVSKEVGIREWLATVDLGRPAPTVAVFDTRVRSPLSGSAARAATRVLRRRGTRVVGRRSFYVTGTQGPLRDGERDEASRWAAELAGRQPAGNTPGSPSGARA